MGETEIKSTKDLKQYIQINAYDNKIELWKLEWGINSFEAGLRNQIPEPVRNPEGIIMNAREIYLLRRVLGEE